jgi:hypothetical protein
MDEDVASVFLLDEAVPFGVVEPFHFSFGHYCNYLLSLRYKALPWFEAAIAPPWLKPAIKQKKTTKAEKRFRGLFAIQAG